MPKFHVTGSQYALSLIGPITRDVTEDGIRVEHGAFLGEYHYTFTVTDIYRAQAAYEMIRDAAVDERNDDISGISLSWEDK